MDCMKLIFNYLSLHNHLNNVFNFENYIFIYYLQKCAKYRPLL